MILIAHLSAAAQSTPPLTLSVPGDLVLECPVVLDPNVTGVATAQSQCSIPVIAFSDAVTPGCGDSRTIARTWSASDACGNVASRIQTITVQDTTAPVLSVPADTTLECPAILDPNVTGVATAQDACGIPVITFSDAVTPGCGDSRTIARTWSATDDCGNVASAIQTITVQDTTAPVLTVPSDITLECPAVLDPNVTGTATAEDACGIPVITFSDNVTPGCGDARVIGRTWSATDECGNVASALQTITVQDTTAPVLSVPPDITLECPAILDPAATGVATAKDACGLSTVTFSDVVTPGCGDSRTIARTWSATDECGNVATALQMIVVEDTTPPVFVTVPVDLILECPADTGTSATGVAAAEDACGTSAITFSDVITPGCGDSRTVVRTWSATDECGNVATTLQMIVVEDTTAPVFVTVPVDLVLECPADTGTNATRAATAVDACSTTVIGFSDDVTPGCADSRSIARTWSATDECGNVATALQMIVVEDTTPPVFVSVPTDLVLECPADTGTNATGVAAAEDACSTTVIDFSDVVTPGCGDSRSIARTWSATDECGNVATALQMITVQDTTPPVFVSVPGDLILECPADTGTNATGVAAAEDACSTTVTEFSDVVTPGCGDSRTIARTWSATDECGNVATVLQMIVVEDTTPPVLTTGSDRTVECGTPWSFEVATAEDACDGTNVLLAVIGTVTNQLIGETFSATRTWQATDSCENASVETQTVTIVDTTPPQIVCPEEIVVECAGRSTEAFFTVTASDICDSNVTVVCTPPSGSAFPHGSTEVVCTATDDSGNVSECTFQVNVVDTTPPTITCPPDLVIAESPRDSGYATGSFVMPSVTDICDLEPGVICTPPSGSSFPVGYTVVECTATDASGNTSMCSFTVRVIPYRLPVTQVGDSGLGSLRQALLDANAGPGENRIEFRIAGAGPHTIGVESKLPTSTDTVIIDGWSQPGFNGTPLINLDGRNATTVFNGLEFLGQGNTIQGMALFGFDTALRFGSTGGHTIQGNHIGTDSSGTQAIGNAGDGIWIQSAGNIIGGGGPGEGNLIVRNGRNGIRLFSTEAVNNQILGNRIGTGLDGLTLLPNDRAGILIEGGASDNWVGSLIPSDANRIGANRGAGVALGLTAGTENRIGINEIDGNGGLGIDLGNDGVTPNDSDDSDTGPNDFQNFPVLNDTRSVDEFITVDGSLTTLPNQVYRLDLFLSDSADPSGYGEGAMHLGYTDLPVGPSGTAEFSISFGVSAASTQFVTAISTDPSGNTSEFSQAQPVRTPPVVDLAPADTNAVAGSSVELCTMVSGTPPIFYQWRLNGANIPGATNSCIMLSAIEAQDAGAYSVIVINDLGGQGTTPASLLVPIENAVPGKDDFADRQPVVGLTGETTGSNREATTESEEPLHAGKPGGKSVWYSWVAPEDGIVTLGTRGSTFDTLLGVYTGESVTNLTAVASDEDRGGFFTSGVRFNVFKGVDYSFAIDGFFGESGDFVFGWDLLVTPHFLPALIEPPESLTVRSNTTAVFNCVPARVCGDGIVHCADPNHYPDGRVPALDVQWFFQGRPIAGATDTSLILSNAQPENVGTYRVEVTATYAQVGISRSIESDPVDLQINQTGVDGFASVQARDKFLDTLLSPPWRIGGLVPSEVPSGQVHAAALTSGYTGTQIFNTVGSSSSSGETVLCGVLGGSSEWITLVTETDGSLEVDTDGSSYDTILAIYQLTTNSVIPQLVSCNNDSAPGVTMSRLFVPVQAGDTYTILVDGVNGASGTLVLNYSLTRSLVLQAGGVNPQGDFTLHVVGFPGMNFTLEGSTNLLEWAALLTTNSVDEVFSFTDTTRPQTPMKYYRAVLLP